MDSLVESFSKLDTVADEGPAENRCPVKVNSPSSSLPDSYKIPRTLAEANLALLESQRYTDVTFIVGSMRSRFKCHKLILIARSSELARLFGPREHGGKELKEYEMADTEQYIFPIFLKFIYTDIFVGVSRMQAIDLLDLACRFKVDLLEEHCVMYLVENVNLQAAPNIFAAAQKTQLEDLLSPTQLEVRDLALDIMAKEFEALLSSVEFLLLDQGMQEIILKELLKRNNLPGSEMDILNYVIRWGKRKIFHRDDNNEELKNNLSSILPLIRFTTMKMFEFANSVIPMNVLPQDIALNILTYLGATGSVRAEYEKKLKGLNYSTTPRYPTIRTDCVIATVSFYCATSTSEELCTRELGPLFETLRFRVEMKTSPPVAGNKDRLLLTHIYLNLPQELNRMAEAPTTQRTDDLHVQVLQLHSLCEETRILSTATRSYGPNELLKVRPSPAVELSDGFDYCIVVKRTTEKKLRKCSPCGELKSYVWAKGLESVAKLCNVQLNANSSHATDLGVGIIRGLELKMARAEKFRFGGTALTKPENFQFSSINASSGPTPLIVPSTNGTTASTVGLPASTTSTLDSLAFTKTPLFGSPSITTASTFGPPAITTSTFGSPATPTKPTLWLPASTAAFKFGSPAITTAFKFGSSAVPTTLTLGSPANTAASTFGSSPVTTISTCGSTAITKSALGPSAITTTFKIGSSAVPTKLTLGSTANTATSTFGSSPVTTISTCGSTAFTKSVLGPSAITTTSTFGSSTITTALNFGSPAVTTTSTFGSPASTTTSLFGSPASTTTSLFGSTAFATSALSDSPTFATSSFGLSTRPYFGLSTSTTTSSVVNTKGTSDQPNNES